MPPLLALLRLLMLCLVLAGCRTSGEPAAVPAASPIAIPSPPTATRGEFTIEADKLDTWNAVGQIAVRTPGVEYQGRAQMLDLYALRYRGVEFLILTKTLLLSETIKRQTTKVTAATPGGKPIDSDAVAELLALFQQELPMEIERVRAKQAAAKKAKGQSSKKKKKS